MVRASGELRGCISLEPGGSAPDPNISWTAPLACPPGSVVKHLAKDIHCDGAKDEDTMIEIGGMGPETATPAEQK